MPSGIIQRSDYESSGGIFEVETAAGGIDRPGSAVISLQLFREIYDHTGHSEGLQAMCQTSTSDKILFNSLSASYLRLFSLKSQQLEFAVCTKAAGAFTDHDDSNLCGYSDAGCQKSVGPALDLNGFYERKQDEQTNDWNHGVVMRCFQPAVYGMRSSFRRVSLLRVSARSRD